MEDLTIEKVVEILNGRNVSRRGRRPRKALAAAAQTNSESSQGTVEHSISSSSNDSNPQDQVVPSEEMLQDKVKRGKKKKVPRNGNFSSVPESLGPSENAVVQSPSDPSPSPQTSVEQKKRGRGRPRKITNLSDQFQSLSVKVIDGTPDIVQYKLN